MNLQTVANFICEYLTKENITFFLSVFGSVGTLFLFVVSLLCKKANIDIKIVECSPSKESVVLYMMFVNKSHLPISITDVRIWNKGIVYSCTPVPTIVRYIRRYTPKEELYFEAIKSIPLPIALLSLSGTSGYFYFQIPQENFECDAKSLTVEVSTNRFLKLEKTLPLPGN